VGEELGRRRELPGGYCGAGQRRQAQRRGGAEPLGFGLEMASETRRGPVVRGLLAGEKKAAVDPPHLFLANQTDHAFFESEGEAGGRLDDPFLDRRWKRQTGEEPLGELVHLALFERRQLESWQDLERRRPGPIPAGQHEPVTGAALRGLEQMGGEIEVTCIELLGVVDD
jgi:hypothetical protein